MKYKKELKQVIREFNQDDCKDTDLEAWARSYSTRVLTRTLSREAYKHAKEGFMIGFIFARKLEGY